MKFIATDFQGGCYLNLCISKQKNPTVSYEYCCARYTGLSRPGVANVTHKCRHWIAIIDHRFYYGVIYDCSIASGTAALYGTPHCSKTAPSVLAMALSRTVAQDTCIRWGTQRNQAYTGYRLLHLSWTLLPVWISKN